MRIVEGIHEALSIAKRMRLFKEKPAEFAQIFPVLMVFQFGDKVDQVAKSSCCFVLCFMRFNGITPLSLRNNPSKITLVVSRDSLF
ncbi:hypothetical protein PC39_14842 [Salinisphaera sp. PC39]